VNVLPKGVRHMPGHLDREAQSALLDSIRAVVAASPL
jgi:alkylated DNA repair protein (DNA oxidative demethylase)